MSSIVEGIVGAAGDIVSGVGKAFKSVVGSDLGRAVLIGAAIYTGYLAYTGQGWFAAASPTAAMGETATGLITNEAAEAAIAEGMTSAGAAGTSVPAGEIVAGVTPAETTAQSLNAAGGQGYFGVTPPGASVPGASGAPSVAGGAGSGTVGGGGYFNVAPPGLIQNTLTAPSFFSTDLAKYGLIQAGAGALQGAFSPNAIDVEQERARLERENLEWRQKFLAPNFNVAGINVGRPSGVQLRDSSGNPLYPVKPNGVIQNSMI